MQTLAQAAMSRNEEPRPAGPVTSITVARPDEPQMHITGRAAWALHALLEAGERGVTPINEPGPRWAHYVYLLKRNHHLDVETVTEAHHGAFAGHHARYILRTPLRVIVIGRQRSKREAV